MSLRNCIPVLLLSIGALVAAPGVVAADEAVDFEALKGNVVIVDFWASWCVPCRRSFPWLNAMHDKYGGDGLVIIGVNLDNDPDDAQAFLDEFPAHFRIHYDRQKQLAEQFDVMAMPSSYILGRDGNVAGRHLGFKVKKEAEYEATIAALLGTDEGHEQ